MSAPRSTPPSDGSQGSSTDALTRRSQQQPALLDSTIAPAPLKDLLAAEGASVGVLSDDSALIDTVQQSAGEQYPIFALGTWSALVEAVEQRRCGIVLLDVDLLGASLERRIAELKGLAPNLVVLVASPRKEAEALMGMLSERKIHRLLMKPVALGITRLLLESAVSRYLELREQPLSVASEDGGAGGGRNLSLGLVAAAALLLLVGAGGAVWWLRGAPEPTQTVRSAVTDAAAQRSAADATLIAGLLARASSAEAEGRLDAPPGDNALDHYLSILRIDPQHAEAGTRMDAVLDILFGRAETALQAGSTQEAAAILARVRRARPDSARLATLEAELEALTRPAVVAAPAPEVAEPEPEPPAPPPVAAPPTELESLLSLAQARLRRGDLLLPAGDSALAYLQRAETLGPDSPQVAAVRGELAVAVVASARVVLGLGQLDQAEALALQARSLGGEEPLITEIEADIGAARLARAQQEESDLLVQGVDRLERGQLVAPDGDNALFYLLSLRERNAQAPQLAMALGELSTRLLAAGRSAVGEQRWPDAEAALAGLERLDPSADAVSALTHELEVARTQAAFLATASPAGELGLLQSVAPGYPESALRNNLEGWVELEFVVDREGRPGSLTVVAAEPDGPFNAAALEAVAQYRFVPFELDGTVYERRVRLRVRFALR